MIVPSRPLEIFGVYDRGIPNAERIVLRANAEVDLSQYALILGVRVPSAPDQVWPIPDQFFWLGKTLIVVPSWIFVFTGSGRSAISQETNTKEPAHNLYWGKPHIALDNQDVVPALLHMDQFEIGNKPNKSISDLQLPKKPDAIDDLIRALLDLNTETKQDTQYNEMAALAKLSAPDSPKKSS